MSKAILTLALLGLTVATAAQADDVVPVAPAKPRLICRRNESTGTRMGATRICRTADEWKQQEDQARRSGEELNDLNRRNAQNFSDPSRI